MIDQVIAALRGPGYAPSRLLDCMLHEAVLGYVDLQVDRENHSRGVARDYGHMLVDLGSERLEIIVPRYTFCSDESVRLLPVGLAYSLSCIPRGHKQRVEHPYVAILRNDRLDVEMAQGSHRDLAHAACLLAAEWKLRP